MSQRGYILSKRLPAALRAIPKGAEMSNPYVAARVVAHDRGRAAGTLVARNDKYAQRIAEQFPSRKRQIVVNPPKTLADVVNRRYATQSLRSVQARTANVQNQGRWAREMSRAHIGKSNYVIAKALIALGRVAI